MPWDADAMQSCVSGFEICTKGKTRDAELARKGSHIPLSRILLRKSNPMVPRYTRPVMAAIWSPENRYRIWFEIEALACEAMAEYGAIPKESARTIREKGDAAMAAFTQADLDQIDDCLLYTSPSQRHCS